MMNRALVGPWLLEQRARFPADVDVDELARLSRMLRRDRELAFYGAEDVIPTEAYGREDAEAAAERVLGGEG